MKYKLQTGCLYFYLPTHQKLQIYMEEKYLSGKDYAIIPADKLITIRTEYLRGTDNLDERILRGLSLFTTGKTQLDERVNEAIEALEETETIPGDMIKSLSKAVCLSQSRLSHLFKRDIGISLNRYMSFMKMNKAYEYVRAGENLTSAALHAVFDSSSHLAAICKRMFGISLSTFMRSLDR